MKQTPTDKADNQATSHTKMVDMKPVFLVFMVILTYGLENLEIKLALNDTEALETSERSVIKTCCLNCLWTLAVMSPEWTLTTSTPLTLSDTNEMKAVWVENSQEPVIVLSEEVTTRCWWMESALTETVFLDTK